MAKQTLTDRKAKGADAGPGGQAPGHHGCGGAGVRGSGHGQIGRERPRGSAHVHSRPRFPGSPTQRGAPSGNMGS